MALIHYLEGLRFKRNIKDINAVFTFGLELYFFGFEVLSTEDNEVSCRSGLGYHVISQAVCGKEGIRIFLCNEGPRDRFTRAYVGYLTLDSYGIAASRTRNTRNTHNKYKTC